MARHSTVAPWAQEIPNAAYPTSMGDLLALPADARWKHEVVSGRLVRTPAGEALAPAIAARLSSALEAFVSPRNLGRVSGTNGVFNLTPPGAGTATGLVPDVAFVRASRLAQRKSAGAVPAGAMASGGKRGLRLAPDLAVEIAVAEQTRFELLEKVKLYLGAGVRLIWVIWPAQRRVDVWLPPIPITGQPTVQLGPSGALDGLQVLPGFTCSVADLFA